MALLLKGAPVAKAINERAQEKVKRLTGTGIEPALAILRVGERADDLSYEKGAVKRCEQVGVKVVKKVLPADIDEESFFKELEELNVENVINFYEDCQKYFKIKMAMYEDHVEKKGIEKYQGTTKKFSFYSGYSQKFTFDFLEQSIFIINVDLETFSL